MKYKIAILFFICSFTPYLSAKTINDKVTRLEKQVKKLAKSEHKAWKEIERLNNEIERLEKGPFKSMVNPIPAS